MAKMWRLWRQTISKFGDVVVIHHEMAGVMAMTHDYHKDISGVGHLSPFPEELEHIVNLSMDIATNSNRATNRLYV